MLDLPELKIMNDPINSLQNKIESCRKCPRLVEWREKIAAEKRPMYADWNYWGKPVPGFGELDAEIMIVGLAPAAHGANRTGRMFTGDRSGDWLYGALHEFGFSDQPVSSARSDGLRLRKAYITASVRCAPPANKPTREEFDNCRHFLLQELRMLTRIRAIVALGKIAFDTVLDCTRILGRNALPKRPPFKHGARVILDENLYLIASYHPSQQNTFTGKLTMTMFRSVFRKAAQIIRR